MKHSSQSFIGSLSTSNFVKNNPLRVVFSTLSSVFGYLDETLSLVFDKLLQVLRDCETSRQNPSPTEWVKVQFIMLRSFFALWP